MEWAYPTWTRLAHLNRSSLLYKSGLSLKVQPNNQDHLFKLINCLIPFLCEIQLFTTLIHTQVDTL
jgi:hypothetical protein